MHTDSTPTRSEQEKKDSGCAGIGCGVLLLVCLLFGVYAAVSAGGDAETPSVHLDRPGRIVDQTATARASGETAYRDFMVAKGRIVSASLGRMSALAAAPLLTIDWKIAVAAEIATQTRTRDEVAARTPPGRYAAAHRRFLAGLDHFVAGGDMLTRGIRANDPALITAAAAELTAGKADVEEATRLLPAAS